MFSCTSNSVSPTPEQSQLLLEAIAFWRDMDKFTDAHVAQVKSIFSELFALPGLSGGGTQLTDGIVIRQGCEYFALITEDDTWTAHHVDTHGRNAQPLGGSWESTLQFLKDSGSNDSDDEHYSEYSNYSSRSGSTVDFVVDWQSLD